MSSKKPVINDVYIYYAKLKRPELQYQKEADPKKPMKNREYVLDALMKHSDLENLIKKYKKHGVKSLAEIKYKTKEEFKKSYKVDPPADSEYANEDGEYGILKFRKNAAYKDGSPNPNKPVVVGFKSLGGKSKNGFEINGTDTDIGGGTLVNLQYSERPYKIPNTGKQGTALDLFALQVINLVEVTREGVGFEDAGDIIESDDLDEDFDDSDGSFEDSDYTEEPEEEEEDWDA